MSVSKRSPRILQGIGLFIAGAVIGSAVFMSVTKHHLDLVLTQNRELIDERNQLLLDNETLKSTKNQYSTINLLNVYVESADDKELDKAAESELRKMVHADLRKMVIGQKVTNFADNHELFEHLLTKKTYPSVLEKDYIVSFRTMVLVQTELRVWVTAKEWKRIPNAE